MSLYLLDLTGPLPLTNSLRDMFKILDYTRVESLTIHLFEVRFHVMHDRTVHLAISDSVHCHVMIKNTRSDLNEQNVITNQTSGDYNTQRNCKLIAKLTVTG